MPRFRKAKKQKTRPLQELRSRASNVDLQELRTRASNVDLQDLRSRAANVDLQDLQERGREQLSELRRSAANIDLERSRGNLQERARDLRKSAAQLDVSWARSAPARFVRENFMTLVMNPIMDYYAARRANGAEQLQSIKQPVILVANHASHMDTPVILSALPRRLRKRTAVAAAADYFYKSRLVASLVSLFFNTVPIERKGGGTGPRSTAHLDSLLDDGWNLLLYPEGTRSRGDGLGRVRRGAAVLASEHNLSIVPIRVTGTAEAMPPGQLWPKRLRSGTLRRHRIEVSFGAPIPPVADPAALVERVTEFFENGTLPVPKKKRRLLGRGRGE